MCLSSTKFTKGFIKRHDKTGDSLSRKMRADIQLAGKYLADNHIHSPFAFALDLRLANLTEVSVTPNHPFVNLILFGSKQTPYLVSLHNNPALYKKHSFLHSK